MTLRDLLGSARGSQTVAIYAMTPEGIMRKRKGLIGGAKAVKLYVAMATFALMDSLLARFMDKPVGITTAQGDILYIIIAVTENEIEGQVSMNDIAQA